MRRSRAAHVIVVGRRGSVRIARAVSKELQLPLQRRDLLGDGRLRVPEPLRRVPEVQGLGQDPEGLQALEVRSAAARAERR